MNRAGIVLIGAMLIALGSHLAGLEIPRPSVLTSGQAEAGRAAFEKSCGQCHTYTLRGRKGEDAEAFGIASCFVSQIHRSGQARTSANGK
jgi:hypothetical protein